MNVDQATAMVRSSLQLAIDLSERRTQELRRFADLLTDAKPGNAPTAECKALLNRFGFCVITRDQAHAIAHALQVHQVSTDFETQAEAEELSKLVAYLQIEAAAALRR